MSTATTVRKVRNGDVANLDTADYIMRVVKFENGPTTLRAVVMGFPRSNGRGDRWWEVVRTLEYTDWDRTDGELSYDGFELVGPRSKVQTVIVRECREMANAILAGEPVPL